MPASRIVEKRCVFQGKYKSFWQYFFTGKSGRTNCWEVIRNNNIKDIVFECLFKTVSSPITDWEFRKSTIMAQVHTQSVSFRHRF